MNQTEHEMLEAGLTQARDRVAEVPVEPGNVSDVHYMPMPFIRLTPINEFQRSMQLFSLAFPTLFPRGEADFLLPRERAITFTLWCQHAMRWHDGRFARHPIFRYVVLNMLMREQINRASRFFV